jgi:hypothetical protein
MSDEKKDSKKKKTLKFQIMDTEEKVRNFTELLLSE